VLVLERGLRVGVERQPAAGEPAGEPAERAGDFLLWQVDEDAVGHEEVRPRPPLHLRQPVLVEQRRGEHAPPVRVREEPAAQFDRVRQVQVDPVHRPVVRPLEARVEPGAEFDHRPARVLGQELANPPVQDHRADHHHEPHRGAEGGQVKVDRVGQLHGLGIFQHRPLAFRFPGPRHQREEQRLLHLPEFAPRLFRHRSILSPGRGRAWP